MHVGWAGVLLVTIAQAIAVARQRVARERELERTAAELRRQVAERSRELRRRARSASRRSRPPRSAAERTIDGRYRVVRKLGAGGMGAVYEVARIADGRRLALKTLRGRADPAAMARFAREAQIAAEIDHPHLVPVIDVGIADDGLFLVMPLVARLARGDARALRRRAWARPCSRRSPSGLAALHARGIVHRDLKPATC